MSLTLLVSLHTIQRELLTYLWHILNHLTVLMVTADSGIAHKTVATEQDATVLVRGWLMIEAKYLWHRFAITAFTISHA